MGKVALLVGVSQYSAEIKPAQNIRDDVEKLHHVLMQTQQFEFVSNASDRSLQETQQAIEVFFQDRHDDDQILFLFSGYGFQETDGKLYLITSSTAIDDRGLPRKATTIPVSFLQAVMDNSPAKQQVVILDCQFCHCFSHSGAPAVPESPVALESQLGGKGRVILTAFSSTQPLTEPQDLPAWSYTRYLTEGIATGAAVTNTDGFLTAEELHRNTVWKLGMAAPAMQPNRYGSEETAMMPLLSVPQYDSVQNRYRQFLEGRIAEGREVNAAGTRFLDRMLLEETQRILQVPPEEAIALEEQALRPQREYQQRLEHYQTLYHRKFAALPQPQEAMGESFSQELRQIQQALFLTDASTAAINVVPYVWEWQQQRDHQQERLGHYEQAFLRTLQRQFLPKPQDRRDLQHLQQALQLQDEEVQAAEARILEHIEHLSRVAPSSEANREAELVAADEQLLTTAPPATQTPDDLLAKIHKQARKTELDNPLPATLLQAPPASVATPVPMPTQIPPTPAPEQQFVVSPSSQDLRSSRSEAKPSPPRSKPSYLPLLIPLILLAAIAGTLLALFSNRMPNLNLGQSARDPDAARQHNAWGAVKAKQGYNDQAIEEFNQAIAADPTNPTPYANRALANHKLGKLDAAEADYDRAIKRLNDGTKSNPQTPALKPQLALVYSNRSHVRYDKGDYQGALDDANTAVATNPNLAQAYVNLANARVKALPTSAGQSSEVIREAAFQDYTRAINLKPELPVLVSALMNRGNLLLSRNDLPAAFQDYNRAIQLYPNYAEAYYNRGVGFQTLNKPDDAARDFAKAADLYQAQGYPKLRDEALAKIKALQQNPTTPLPPSQPVQSR